ncbi:TonB-dependent receptor [Massilia sp. TS11]|uniref:TonB-dependent receptor n=1 Tax=Massilia sp. TS11 TaxID=2908003 RepID=UPI001EDAE4C4|nr:TonB-dependent receptor [Massilia sp. TS11]MCG2585419.1 TonB-dependent receptor [Massilia sp. TS11]
MTLFRLTPIALALCALSAHADDTAAAPEAAAPDQTAEIPKVEVIGSHFKAARVELAPKVGTTIYSLDTHMFDKLAQGDAAQFNDVLQRLPGVSADSKGSGSLHIRGDHSNMQYRINGVQLPEGISGFGQSFDTRLVDQLDFMTGALPAQYGIRTAGVIEIQTKEGGLTPGGRVGVLLGSRDHVEPSGEVFGSVGKFNYYLSASYLKNAIGIENPQPTRNALHDDTRQGKGFGSLSYFVDDETRVGVLFSSYRGRFEIPNNPGQTPAYSYVGGSKASDALDDRQREQNQFIILSLQKTLGDRGYQLSVFNQSSELHYTPDLMGDLIYTGVASDALRQSHASGVQFDGNLKLSAAHILRAGFAWTRQTTESRNLVSVFPTDADGVQTSTTPRQIVDNNGMMGKQYSLYVQDEWHPLPDLTVNYGLRLDKVAAYVHEQQLSPRVNLSYQLDPETALHAGYSRYFTPPKQEIAAQAKASLYAGTSNAAEITAADPVRAERTHYYDVGLSRQISKALNVSIDAYYKDIRNLLDAGQFGQALILTPFNYAKAHAQGIELALLYTEKNWGGFLNLATQKAVATQINSGQNLFGQDELDQIARQYIHVDHDQTYTASAGGHYHIGAHQFSGDVVYGSGLRMTPDGAVPNSGHLPGYTVFNVNYTHTWKTALGKLEARLALLNAFDRVYLLRDGSGVGVGAPQHGQRRTLYAGLNLSF